MKTTKEIIMGAMMQLLYPLVRLLIKHGISCGEFCEWVKWAYVEVADKEFLLDGKKQTKSRVSLLTGLTRKDVQRIQESEKPDLESLSLKYNRSARVITGWLRDANFSESKGMAKQLKMDGPGASFTNLVNKYSGDMSVKAVFDELFAAGNIVMSADGFIKLKNSGFISKLEDDKFRILGEDCSLLIDTISFNLGNEKNETRFQKKVCYKNLSLSTVKQFKILVSEKNMELLLELDNWLANQKNMNDQFSEQESFYSAGVGIYYFEKIMKEGN